VYISIINVHIMCTLNSHNMQPMQYIAHSYVHICRYMCTLLECVHYVYISVFIGFFVCNIPRINVHIIVVMCTLLVWVNYVHMCIFIVFSGMNSTMNTCNSAWINVHIIGHMCTFCKHRQKCAQYCMHCTLLDIIGHYWTLFAHVYMMYT
jgi:hypothetical protein